MTIEIKNPRLGGEDHNLYAQRRLKQTFKGLVLEVVENFEKADKSNKMLHEWFNQGGGATWSDIKKAIQDDSDIGNEWLEAIRQLMEAEMISRGVLSPQLEKKPVE